MSDKWKELFGSEWERIKRYGSAIVDPDDKKVFWESIVEAKRQDPNWSFESVQPSKKTATEKARDACCAFVKSLRHAKKEQEDVG